MHVHFVQIVKPIEAMLYWDKYIKCIWFVTALQLRASLKQWSFLKESCVKTYRNSWLGKIMCLKCFFRKEKCLFIKKFSLRLINVPSFTVKSFLTECDLRTLGFHITLACAEYWTSARKSDFHLSLYTFSHECEKTAVLCQICQSTQFKLSAVGARRKNIFLTGGGFILLDFSWAPLGAHCRKKNNGCGNPWDWN